MAAVGGVVPQEARREAAVYINRHINNEEKKRGLEEKGGKDDKVEREEIRVSPVGRRIGWIEESCTQGRCCLCMKNTGKQCTKFGNECTRGAVKPTTRS